MNPMNRRIDAAVIVTAASSVALWAAAFAWPSPAISAPGHDPKPWNYSLPAAASAISEIEPNDDWVFNALPRGDGGTMLTPPSGCEDGAELRLDDNTIENAYAWQFADVQAPDQGAFAVQFPGLIETELCSVEICLTQTGGFDGQTMDVILWSDDNGRPGTVLAVLSGYQPETPAMWPAVSIHSIEVPEWVAGPDPWWIGFWGNWPGEAAGYYIAADLNGPGYGSPMTRVSGGGWQLVADLVPAVRDLGIRVTARPTPPLLSTGELHNAILDGVMTHPDDPAQDPIARFTKADLDQAVSLTNEAASELGMDPRFGAAFADSLDRLFSDKGFYYVENGITYFGSPFTTDQTLHEWLDWTTVAGELSPELLGSLHDWLSFANTGPVPDDALAAFDLICAAEWTEREHEILASMRDIYVYSLDYWSPGRVWDGGGAEATADVVGGCTGKWLGGWVGGAAGSLFGPAGAVLGVWVGKTYGPCVFAGLSSYLAKNLLMAAPSEEQTFDGFDVGALAGSALDVRTGSLVIWDPDMNEVLDAECTSSLGDVHGIELEWSDLNDGVEHEVGDELVLAFRTAGGPSGGETPRVRITQQEIGPHGVAIDVRPDSGAVGHQYVVAFTGNAVVADQVGSAESFVLTDLWPDSGAFAGQLVASSRSGYVLTWPWSVDITLYDGSVVSADRILVGTVGVTDAVAEISRLELDAVGFESISVQAIDELLIGVTSEVSPGESPLQSEVAAFVVAGTPVPRGGVCAFQFRAPNGTSLSLDIFDVTGRHVETLYRGRATGGAQSIEWSPSAAIGAPSRGVLFARLRHGSSTLVRRVVIFG